MGHFVGQPSIRAVSRVSKKESKSSSKMVLVVQLSRQYSKCNFDDDLDTLTGTWDSIILPGRLKYHCIAFRIHQIGFHIQDCFRLYNPPIPNDKTQDSLCVMVTCLIVLFLLQTLLFQCSLPVESALAPTLTTPSLVDDEKISLPFTVNIIIYLARSVWSRSNANGSFQHGVAIPFLHLVFFFITSSPSQNSLMVMQGSGNTNRNV